MSDIYYEYKAKPKLQAYIQMARYSATTDQELLNLLSRDNEAAFNELYNRYNIKMFRYANKLLDEQEAMDVVQDIFVTLWEKRGTQVIHTSLPAYLFHCIYNKALNIFTHQQSKRKYLDSFVAYVQSAKTLAPDEFLLEKDLQQRVADKVAAFPRQMKTVFELSRTEQFSHLQISEELGISKETVRTQLKRSLRLLRAHVGSLLTALL